jgi:hypothetical protein
MKENCVTGLIRVSEEKHTFALPKTTSKTLMADTKVRRHVNCIYRDVNNLRHS